MAKKAYIGVNRKARGVKRIYVGVDGVAHEVYKGYIGDEQGKARLFWEKDRVNHYLRLNFEHDETGTFEFGFADIGLTVRYVLEQWLLVFEGYRDPDIVKQMRDNIADIMGWVRRHTPDNAYVAITTGWQPPSSGIRGGRFTLRVAYTATEDIERTVTGSSVVEGYKHYIFNTSGARTWSYWNIGITRSGIEYPVNVNPSTISLDIDTIGLKYENNNKTSFTCTNFGIYFTEYDVQVGSPLLYWKYQHDKTDTIRDVLLVCGIGTNNYYTFNGSQAIRLPTWIYPYLYATTTISFAINGTVQLAVDTSQDPNRVRPTRFFVTNNADGLYFVEDDIIPTDEEGQPIPGEDPIPALSLMFNNNAGQGSTVIKSQVRQGEIGDYFFVNSVHGGVITFYGSFEVEIDYEGFWNLMRNAVDSTTATSNLSANAIELGFDKYSSLYSASGAVTEIRVTRKPIDFSHFIFWTEFYHVPDGLNIQYNKIVSNDYDDFAEYLGTDKTLIYTYTSGDNPVWMINTRNFSNYAKVWIRSPGGTTKSRIYIPINHLDFDVQSLSDGPYMRISARAYNGSSSTRLLFGMAYIENGALISTGYYHDADLINQTRKYHAHENWGKVDYIWFEDTTDNRVLMISTVKIGKNWDEVQ